MLLELQHKRTNAVWTGDMSPPSPAPGAEGNSSYNVGCGRGVIGMAYLYSFCFGRTQYFRLETVRNQCALKLARTVCHPKCACPQCLHFSPLLIRSMLAACYRLAGQCKRDFPIIGRSNFSYSSEVLWLQSLRCTRNRQIPERDVKSAENVSC